MTGMLFLLVYGCRSEHDKSIENSQPTIEIIVPQDQDSFADGYNFELHWFKITIIPIKTSKSLGFRMMILPAIGKVLIQMVRPDVKFE